MSSNPFQIIYLNMPWILIFLPLSAPIFLNKLYTLQSNNVKYCKFPDLSCYSLKFLSDFPSFQFILIISLEKFFQRGIKTSDLCIISVFHYTFGFGCFKHFSFLTIFSFIVFLTHLLETFWLIIVGISVFFWVSILMKRPCTILFVFNLNFGFNVILLSTLYLLIMLQELVFYASRIN